MGAAGWTFAATSCIGSDHVKLTGSAQRGRKAVLGSLGCGEATVEKRYCWSRKSVRGMGSAGLGAATRSASR